MTGRHAYGSDTRNRLATLGYLALLCLFFNMGGLAVIRWVFEFPILKDFKPYTWPMSPVTMTMCFAGVYWLYNNVLWKKFSRVPNISGTWIGVVLPNYQTNWPHLEIISVEQTWSEFSFTGDVFFRTEKGDPWQMDKRLGTYNSIAAGLSDVTAKHAHLSLCYFHRGKRHNQPDFQGAMYLDYQPELRRLDGKYYTNRMDTVNRTQGSLGRVILYHLSLEILSSDKAFEQAGPHLLKALEDEILRSLT